MKNIKLIIEFDGRNFCGWQRQPNGKNCSKSHRDSNI